jgi:hypothetical protein
MAALRLPLGGNLTSRRFTIDRNFIRLWVGGGSHKGHSCANVVVGGKVVQSVTGQNDNKMTQQTLEVRKFQRRRTPIKVRCCIKGSLRDGRSSHQSSLI